MTSSPPVRLSCITVHHSLKVLWLPHITSYWGICFHHLHSSCHRRLLPCKNSQLQPPPHQCPNDLLGPKDETLCQILWRAHIWAELLQRLPWDDPQPQEVRDTSLVQNTQAQLHQVVSQDSDMVKEARRKYFSKHSYNFTTDGTHNLSRTFRHLAASANLLATSIYKM